MHKQLSLVFATLALSTVAFGQVLNGPPSVFDSYQIGYAANLNIGDSVINITNAGTIAGFTAPLGAGNICVNVYTFDPAEEEISCCACLVTPNGLNSLSAKADLINNPLTPAIPTSIVVKLLATTPGVDKTGHLTICNPSLTTIVPPTMLAPGMTVWGDTLEPAATPGTYAPVNVPFQAKLLSASEATALVSTCTFIQSDGSGYGICNSCQTGALAGKK